MATRGVATCAATQVWLLWVWLLGCGYSGATTSLRLLGCDYLGETTLGVAARVWLPGVAILV